MVCSKSVCLTCPDEKSKAMENALDDWAKTLAGRGKKCGLLNSDWKSNAKKCAEQISASGSLCLHVYGVRLYFIFCHNGIALSQQILSCQDLALNGTDTKKKILL